MSRIRVLVVEDSLTVRRRLEEVIAADPHLELVGLAATGKEGFELCMQLRPDIVTMDMMLPVMTGLEATEHIMAQCPTPILVVSSSVNRGEVFNTYEALAAGAVDVLDKPTGLEPAGEWERKLIAAIKLVSRIRVITHPRPRSMRPIEARLPPAHVANHQVIAVGASTGGPRAVIDVLRALPRHFCLPILLVLHINELFASSFATWLDKQTPWRVDYGRDGDRLETLAGRVVMAPPGRHLAVQGGRILLSSEPERHSCRPSVDVLFNAVARDYGARAVGVLLTGMGRDGAAGLLDMRRAGAFTIAQDEASSVVYGMPREAALLGAAEQVLPLDQIGPMIGVLSARPREVHA